MELQRLDPESGGASRISIDSKDEEIFLGRNPTAQITDTLISRKQASIVFDKNSQNWKLKSILSTKPCYHKKSNSEEWKIVSEEVSLASGDKISLLKQKYVYECSMKKDENETLKNDFVEFQKPKTDFDEIEKPKRSIGSVGRVLPAWMMDLDDEEKVSGKNKKDQKTPTKQVQLYFCSFFSVIFYLLTENKQTWFEKCHLICPYSVGLAFILKWKLHETIL